MVAIKAFLKLENGQPDYLLKLLALIQGAFYIEIMGEKPNQQRFGSWLAKPGWLEIGFPKSNDFTKPER